MTDIEYFVHFFTKLDFFFWFKKVKIPFIMIYVNAFVEDNPNNVYTNHATAHPLLLEIIPE